MKPPADLDPDMRTVLEIVQHAGEILSRLPLRVLRMHLQERPGESEWRDLAVQAVLTAEAFELANATLSAEEARELPKLYLDSVYPDDALPS